MAPLYLLGAKRMEANKIRLVFMSPAEGNPNVMDGRGAVLEITGFGALTVSGDHSLKPSLLEAWVETMVEGDEETQGLGPIPCGFAISGDEMQLVTYNDCKPLISCYGKYFSYMADIDISDKTDD